MSEQAAVLQYLIDRLARYPDVELAAVYGSFGTPDATATSDVDIFFVPSSDSSEHDSGGSAALQVIVGEIGYDLWPVSWERLARIAALSDVLTPLLLDSRVVFGKQPAVARFETLRAECRETLGDPVRRLRAARTLADRAAADLAARPGGQRLATVDAASTLLTAIAFSGGQHLHTNPGRILDGHVDWLPDDLRDVLRRAVAAPAAADRETAIRRALRLMSRLINDSSIASEPQIPVPEAERADRLTGFYEELHSVLNKIPRAAEARDVCTMIMAVTIAVDEIGNQLHFLRTGLPPVDDDQLLDAYRAAELPELLDNLDDPAELAAQAQALMIMLPEYLERRGVRILRVPDAAALARLP